MYTTRIVDIQRVCAPRCVTNYADARCSMEQTFVCCEKGLQSIEWKFEGQRKYNDEYFSVCGVCAHVICIALVRIIRTLLLWKTRAQMQMLNTLYQIPQCT